MYVYCAVNPSMPGLVKVGMTANQPSVRMGQLSSLTAVPTPFECSWYAYSANPAADCTPRTAFSCSSSRERAPAYVQVLRTPEQI